MSTKVVCIACPLGCLVEVDKDKISGHKCPKGKEYALIEAANPVRIFTGSVRIKEGEFALLSVRSTSGVPKRQIRSIAEMMRKIVLIAPFQMGQVVLADVLGTGVDIVATRTVARNVAYQSE
jgi:CxxC motif-containing protein